MQDKYQLHIKEAEKILKKAELAELLGASMSFDIVTAEQASNDIKEYENKPQEYRKHLTDMITDYLKQYSFDGELTAGAALNFKREFYNYTS